jgi:hypothetical protein
MDTREYTYQIYSILSPFTFILELFNFTSKYVLRSYGFGVKILKRFILMDRVILCMRGGKTF